MSFGLQVTTDSGEWVVNEQVPALHYLGQAVFVGAVGDGVAGEQIGKYRITSSAAPFVLLRMAVNSAASSGRVVNVGTNLWEIDVFGDPSAVLCYGPLGSAAPQEPWGLRVWDAAGNVTFDTTRFPLWVSEVFSLTGSSGTFPNAAPFPAGITLARSYTAPAIAAYSAGSYFRSIGAAGNPGSITNDIRRLGWQRTATGYVPVWLYTALGTYSITTVSYDHYSSGIAGHSILVAETTGL